MAARFFTIFIFLILAACSNNSSPAARAKAWMTPNGKIKILATVEMIDDLVARVGGERVDVLCLIKGDLDPHSYQLVKGDDEKFFYATLIFSNGLGLEHGFSLQNILENNKKVISVGNLLKAADPELILHFRGQVDPHIWMDASMWAKTIPFIVTALSEKDPDHASYYKENGQKLEKELLGLHHEIRNTLQEIPEKQRYLVTSHDAFNYFTRAYLAAPDEKTQADWQKRFAAPEGLAPESQISATDIQDIIDHLHQYQIHVLFPESNVSRDSIVKIVQAGREKGLELKIAKEPLFADAMGAPGTEDGTYVGMIRHNGEVISHYLRNNRRE